MPPRPRPKKATESPAVANALSRRRALEGVIATAKREMREIDDFLLKFSKHAGFVPVVPEQQ